MLINTCLCVFANCPHFHLKGDVAVLFDVQHAQQFHEVLTLYRVNLVHWPIDPEVVSRLHGDVLGCRGVG